MEAAVMLMTGVYVRVREAIGSLLWWLHLPRAKGWWDAGTDNVKRAAR